MPALFTSPCSPPNLGSIYRCFPFPFLGYIVPYERRGTAKFGYELSAFRLEYIANNDPCSFSDE